MYILYPNTMRNELRVNYYTQHHLQRAPPAHSASVISILATEPDSDDEQDAGSHDNQSPLPQNRSLSVVSAIFVPEGNDEQDTIQYTPFQSMVCAPAC